MAALSDISGSAVAQYSYNPYGKVIASSGSMAVVNPFRFSTKYTDDETGLIYYGRRFYSPTLGRFINRDPMQERGGINLFAFVLNNPTGRYDPYGLTWWDDFDNWLAGVMADPAWGGLMLYLGPEAKASEEMIAGITASIKYISGAFSTIKAEKCAASASAKSLEALEAEYKILLERYKGMSEQMSNALRQAGDVEARGGLPNPHGLGKELQELIPAELKWLQIKMGEIENAIKVAKQ